MSSARPEEQTKTLSALGLTAQGGREAEITGITVDSREVMPGYLFAALPGGSVHGADFIATALELQAGAILTDAEGARRAADEIAESDVALIVAEDPRQTLAQTAALWFGRHPSTVVAVTGTNGKTSVSTFCRQIWIEMGEEAVNLGTTGVEGAWTHGLRHTTPDPITLHRVLAEAARQGITHVAMEASSHGLDQRRLDGMILAAAGFTNFTQDHLDYHKTFDAYFDAKMGLFTRVLADDGVAVVNLDDPKGPLVAQIAEERGQEVIGVGRHPEARLRILGQRFDATGQELRFEWQGRSKLSRLDLIGGFQAENVLMAAALTIGAGAAPDEVFDVLRHLQTVRGRMQLAATRDNGATVFVDYSHTPDSVGVAIRALRPHVIGRIIAVVGAGGDRDRGKRPLMGAAAAENADKVIVTDDNPRSEDPADIRAAVLDGAPGAIEIGDRAEAILRGADMLEPGDALLICGKGHETGQIVGDAILPFDDVEQASVAVAALDGRI
ncbi:UDP-N-acetylmuramoyl-L-alanyl-D-glutamate--2,6-diaminopimelate ligase [Pelagovum pacificum]|uniref:UDP-N-acetylmuramoyl-L-alanyl-D-glutamate--2,6-diaminopimelate ligase n=1 Tax=Pelagovum pacificum TaxID=2588711 RepID=A0A5C5GF81_9RHOB|nr:UDP-N-acetylmuramoyl-L-alanyl-D-glutamate--2,6-diaminopimelate ligase [Pelagovum pacificum]QQA44158.1 UDP-N-acetylmuramoyl-L-alanyl-D-glutamate--2,6-diaminopimelate ligase [Pelagovum pacificum]TNY32717.1 UDP-N-acetylmuramoyl-L-alanyl-D-glutamate--2,6-diaminopimelate ligase [Pelagovum pacificum]